MRIGIYEDPGQTPYNPVLAFAEGVAALGHSVVYRNPSAFVPSQVETFDLVAVWGLHGQRDSVRAAYVEIGVPCIVIDLGFIKRREYFQVGIGCLNWLPATECPSDRLAALGIQLPDESHANPRGHVISCHQLPGDFAHRMDAAELNQWFRSMETGLARCTGKDVYPRPHPYVSTDSKRTPLSTLWPETWAILTYNSNSGHEALLAGIPVFCDECAPYALLGNTLGDDHDPRRPYFPSKPDLEAYFSRLAYAQWTLAEMETGEAFQFMENQL